MTKPEEFTIPQEPELLAAVRERIASCREQRLFRDPPVTELTTNVVLKQEAPGQVGPQEAAAEATGEGLED